MGSVRDELTLRADLRSVNPPSRRRVASSFTSASPSIGPAREDRSPSPKLLAVVARRVIGRAIERARANAKRSPAARPPRATAAIAAVARPTFSCTVCTPREYPHRPDELALVEDRGRSYSDVATFVIAPPNIGRRPRGERLRDLRPPGRREGLAHVLAVGVDQHGPVGVQDRDPSSDICGVSLRVPGEPPPLPRVVGETISVQDGSDRLRVRERQRLELGAGRTAARSRGAP